MLAGNTREDGTPNAPAAACTPGRPIAATASTTWRPSSASAGARGRGQLAWLAARRGFRAPQATELYRLQSGQAVADLDSERLDSIELGWRGTPARISWELAAFRMQKRNYIFRDGDGFNVADGRTRHVGMEVAFQWQLTPRLRLETEQSLARHTWRFNRDVGQGEVIVSGNETDSAPRLFGSTRLSWRAEGGAELELEWLAMGPYWLDAANTARYDGHDLLHLRVRQPLGHGLHLALRLHNIADRAYAERADFAFGQYRYFPGRERSLFVELGWRGP
jgi:iron complex outermembrane recepter protein